MSDSRVWRFGAGYFRKLLPVVVIPGVLYVAYYWSISKYGLYEDDLTFIPNAIQMNFQELIEFIANYLQNLYGHGRPLSDSLIHLFSFIGWRLGELRGIYLFGYGLELLNALLLYSLLRRLHPDRGLALLGALVFILYPADTTKIFLTHSLGLHPSILLVLLALHSYLSRKWLLAYLLATIVTFSYETPFPVFLAAPLLTFEWDRRLIKRFLIHGLILGIMLALTYLLRVSIGEARVAGLSWPEILTVPMNHMVIGPIVALGTFIYRPIQVLISFDPMIITIAVVGTILFGWLLRILTTIPAQDNDPAPANTLLRGATRWKNWAQLHLREVQLLVSGLVMLVAAYALTFTTRAYALTGRDTRVHASGVLGCSLIIAVVAYLILNHPRRAFRSLAFVTIVMLFGFLSAFGFMIQGEYVRAWELQQEFWSDLLPLIQDVEPGSVVLIDPQGMEDTHQIWANHWNLPRVLVQLYSFPDTWRPLPRVYRLVTDWEHELVGVDGLFRIDESTVVAPTSTYQEVENTNVVLVRFADGHLERQHDPLVIDGQSYPLKPISQPTLPDLEEGFLFELFIDG